MMMRSNFPHHCNDPLSQCWGQDKQLRTVPGCKEHCLHFCLEVVSHQFALWTWNQCWPQNSFLIVHGFASLFQQTWLKRLAAACSLHPTISTQILKGCQQFKNWDAEVSSLKWTISQCETNWKLWFEMPSFVQNHVSKCIPVDCQNDVTTIAWSHAWMDGCPTHTAVFCIANKAKQGVECLTCMENCSWIFHNTN